MNSIRHNILLLLVFAIFLSAKTYAVSASDARHSFFILTPDSVNKLPAFTDDEFYAISTGVVFKVNSTQISAGDQFLQVYRNEIMPMVNRRHLQLKKIFIRGAASPEGPYANNQRLARGRSEALLNELKRDLVFQYIDAAVDVSSVTEDYGYLCVLMKNANDRDYATVKAVYDGCDGDELCCKKRLMAYDRGRLWQRLLKEYFPQLRSARLILWFSEPDVEHAANIDMDLTLPEADMPLVGPVQMDLAGMDSLSVVLAQPVVSYDRRRLLAVRTNLVHDFFVMPNFGFAPSPNIQFEYYPRDGHLTYNVGMTWGTRRKWDSQEFWQVRDFQAELRRYFKGNGTFTGTYLGAYVHGDKYGIGLDAKKGWQGEGGGVGLSVGHTMCLNKKGSLRLEVMAAAGFFLTVFDPYVYGNPITGTIDGDYYYDYYGNASSFKRRNHRFTWLGPTNLGIQLTYDIIYRKKHIVQKGGSL